MPPLLPSLPLSNDHKGGTVADDFRKVHACEAGLAEGSEWEERCQDWGSGHGCDGLVFFLLRDTNGRPCVFCQGHAHVLFIKTKTLIGRFYMSENGRDTYGLAIRCMISAFGVLLLSRVV